MFIHTCIHTKNSCLHVYVYCIVCILSMRAQTLIELFDLHNSSETTTIAIITMLYQLLNDNTSN